MTEEAIITANIVTKDINVTEYADAPGLDAVNYSGGDDDSSDVTVTVDIIKPGVDPQAAVVTMEMVSEIVFNHPARFFAAAEYGTVELKWAREITEGVGGSPNTRDTYLHIYISHPESPGNWFSTKIVGIQKVGEETVYAIVQPAPGGGEIPSDGEPLHGLSFESVITNSQTQMVPGELLQLEWVCKYAKQSLAGRVAGVYFHTPATTGGVVKAKIGVGTDTRWLISFEGETQTLAPTDFAEYEIGEWVFLLKQGDSSATDTDRKTEYGDEAETSDTASSEDLIGGILTIVNQERFAAGLNPLTANASLERAAQRHSDDMAENEYMDHSGSDGSTTLSRIEDAGYLNSVNRETEAWGVGENVAFGQASAWSVMDAWMHSANHRANILSDQWIDIGIAVAYSSDLVPYYTQDFGLRSVAPDLGDEVRRPYPITVNNVENGGDFEAKDYDMLNSDAFEKFFEMSQHVGKIITVDTDNDTADIEISGMGVFTGVEIFYHCQDSNTVAGGAAAFAVDDDVLVMNEYGSKSPAAGDLYIVGFPDELRSCFATSILLSDVSGAAVLWDVENNVIMSIPGIEYPSTFAEIQSALPRAVFTELISSGEESTPSLTPTLYGDYAVGGLAGILNIFDKEVSLTTAWSRDDGGPWESDTPGVTRIYDPYREMDIDGYWELGYWYVWIGYTYVYSDSIVSKNFFNNKVSYISLPGNAEEKHYQSLWEEYSESDSGTIRVLSATGDPEKDNIYSGSRTDIGDLTVSTVFDENEKIAHEELLQSSATASLQLPASIFRAPIEPFAYTDTYGHYLGVADHEDCCAVFSGYYGLTSDVAVKVQTKAPGSHEDGFTFNWDSFRSLDMDQIKTYLTTDGMMQAWLVHKALPA